MSNYKLTPVLVGKQQGRESYARLCGESYNHMVRWVHDMYSRGRSPLASINEQARALHLDESDIKMEVLVACRPGGHGPAIEKSKRRYTLEWKVESK